ncbi:MAG TPA: bifunctional helix-turn-helix transcriptional regulator/GNAT family N-acetyltransferase [Polyangia bacterium]
MSVAAVRAFNRFYTQKIGVLDEGLLASPYSLAEVRLMYELAQRGRGGTDGTTTATELRRALGLDAGYLSRMLKRLAARHLVSRRPSRGDKRESLLSLTARGRSVFAGIDARSDAAVTRLLAPLDRSARDSLVMSMHLIEALLGGGKPALAPVMIRGPRPGELGWIVQRHGALYAQEYGWDARFEGLVAEIVGAFAAGHDALSERCFIADSDGAPVGSVMVVKQSKRVAKLRLLLVEPSARGAGVGARLVDECIRFARGADYRRLELWTNSVLVAARRIYERAGFVLVAEAEHHSFGDGLVGQTFRLEL